MRLCLVCGVILGSSYVVLLNPKVKGNKRVQNQNPDWDGKRDCYYVGHSGKTPEERFQDHKEGHKAGRGIVQDYGVRTLERRA